MSLLRLHLCHLLHPELAERRVLGFFDRGKRNRFDLGVHFLHLVKMNAHPQTIPDQKRECTEVNIITRKKRIV